MLFEYVDEEGKERKRMKRGEEGLYTREIVRVGTESDLAVPFCFWFETNEENNIAVPWVNKQIGGLVPGR